MTHAPRSDRRPSAGDQVNDLVIWMRANPIRGVLFLLLAGGAAATILNPPIQALPDRLNVADCVYARTSAATETGPDARPIGEPSEVEEVVTSGAAERAACGLSHGHEVSLVVELPDPASLVPSGAPGVPQPDRDALRADVQRRCDAAFQPYVHHALAGSVYLTFAVVPTREAWLGGSRIGLCLVARADGQWMAHPARETGE